MLVLVVVFMLVLGVVDIVGSNLETYALLVVDALDAFLVNVVPAPENFREGAGIVVCTDTFR